MALGVCHLHNDFLLLHGAIVEGLEGGVGNTEGQGIVCLSLVRGGGIIPSIGLHISPPPFPTETACSMQGIYPSNCGLA